jgi:hypothetical protein
VSAVRPTVTIAIPLHRSRPFVDVVVANIAAVDVPDAEIIVSDRTVEDDAAEVIAAATSGDPRVRVVAAADGLTWVAHHAALLDAAAAPLAMLMPHDDDFPRGWVTAMIDALEREPDALVAFGDVRPSFLDLPHPGPPPPRSRLRRGRPSAADAARLFTFWPIGLAYRGVLRIDRLRALGVRHRSTPGTAWADDLLMFEIALEGRLLHVPGPISVKRFHAGSTHMGWSTGPVRTARLHLLALGLLVRRGRDRSLPWAAALIVRRWVGYVAMDRARRRRR